LSAPEACPWQGTAYRHLPADSPYGPLDTRFAARSRENRWNSAGAPTLALAGSPEQLVQEFRQHIARNRDAALAPLYQPRRVFEIELRLQRMFDVTDAATLDALGIQGAPDCFEDRAVARATADFLRHTRKADGLLVPSRAAFGDTAHRNLIVFLDLLSEPLDVAVQRVRAISTFQIQPILTAASTS